MHGQNHIKNVFQSILINSIYTNAFKKRGTQWRSWFRHCATSWKVAGSISDGVTGIFHWHNPSGRTMALESTQPLTEMSTRNIYWEVKTAGEQGWQPYHLHVSTVFKSEGLNLLEISGPLQTSNGTAFQEISYLLFFAIKFYKHFWSLTHVLHAQLLWSSLIWSFEQNF